jgi:hypothetical protein
MSRYHRATLSALLFLVVGIDNVKPSQPVTEKNCRGRSPGYAASTLCVSSSAHKHKAGTKTSRMHDTAGVV